MTSAPAAVLWDMDGTLIDSEPYWLAAETELVESYGGTWTLEDGLQLVGSELSRSARILQSRGVELEVPEILTALSSTVEERLFEHVPWRPGALELLREIHEAGIRSALVTMSLGTMARHVAASTGFDGFSLVVPGDEVTNGKPHPEPYLTAAATFGVDPHDCVALEDSAPGAASAVASGAATIAVPAHVPLPESSAYTLWTGGLAGRTVADLSEVLAAHRAAHAAKHGAHS